MTEMQQLADERSTEEAAQAPIQMGYPFSVGHITEARVMAAIAAAPVDTDDEVAIAARRALSVQLPEISIPVVDAADVDPACEARRFTLVRVHDFPIAKGRNEDVVIMRGDFAEVLGAVRIGREDRTVLKKNVAYAERRGRRVLGVAIAPVDGHGRVGHFVMEGFLAIRLTSQEGVQLGMEARPVYWIRVNVWSAALRFQHWANVALIFILSCTGYYIMDPFFGPTAGAEQGTGFLMGWVRVIHFVAAGAWLILGLTRVIGAFTSRDRYLRWPALWPLKDKEDVRNLGRTVQFYGLMRDEAPLYLAHNPLQQLTYTGIYALCAIQMATGLVLYGLNMQDNALWRVVSSPIHWTGIPTIRLIHTMIMFFLWVFVVIHVYLAVRADSLERHGGVSAMINGGVWLRRGAQPVDAPGLE